MHIAHIHSIQQYHSRRVMNIALPFDVIPVINRIISSVIGWNYLRRSHGRRRCVIARLFLLSQQVSQQHISLLKAYTLLQEIDTESEKERWRAIIQAQYNYSHRISNRLTSVSRFAFILKNVKSATAKIPLLLSIFTTQYTNPTTSN